MPDTAPTTPRERAAARFPWPRPPGAGEAPRWTGAGFRVDGRDEAVLSYLMDRSGWSDDLTAMHEAEAGADHPIDVASRDRAVAELTRTLGRGEHRIVEVGCSSGYMVKDLRRAFPSSLVIGADYVGAPLRSLAQKEPSIPLLQLDLTRFPLGDATVDAIVALNVLEHIEDDARAVREIYRALRPGGVAYIELPAGPRLYDVHDKVLMHHRRYTRRGAVALFERAGFAVERVTHLGFLVWPAFVAVKLRAQRHLSASEDEQRAIVARMIRESKASPGMKVAMGLETALAKVARFPVGIRVVLTAVKR